MGGRGGGRESGRGREERGMEREGEGGREGVQDMVGHGGGGRYKVPAFIEWEGGREGGREGEREREKGGRIEGRRVDGRGCVLGEMSEFTRGDGVVREVERER